VKQSNLVSDTQNVFDLSRARYAVAGWRASPGPAPSPLVGGPTAILEYGGVRWLTDPTLSPPGEYAGGLVKTTGPTREPASIEPVDVVLLSHEHHSDNLDPEGRELLPRAGKERLTQMRWRQVRGKARRGEVEEGERLAREAVALGAETDILNAHGDALTHLAEVLNRAGRDARGELEQALALYERKGNLAMAERTRSKLAELKPST
jgi:hypothetical protein